MPNIGSHVVLTSGEFGVVSNVTPKGDDDRVKVVREWHGVPIEKEIRVTAWQIRELLYEPEPE